MSTTALETAPEAPPPAPRASGYRPHRMTVERYERMVELGVYDERDPVFLWKGQLVEKMTKHPPHNFAMTELNAALVRVVPAGWFVRQEQPIVLGDYSEPEPDFTVVRGVGRDYARRTPSARDLALVVEVSDSSLAVDSGEKLEAYALEGIPLYWLVNLPERRIEVYSRPEGTRYAVQELFGPDDEVPVALDGREVGRVAVRDVLP